MGPFMLLWSALKLAEGWLTGPGWPLLGWLVSVSCDLSPSSSPAHVVQLGVSQVRWRRSQKPLGAYIWKRMSSLSLHSITQSQFQDIPASRSKGIHFISWWGKLQFTLQETWHREGRIVAIFSRLNTHNHLYQLNILKEQYGNNRFCENLVRSFHGG